MSQSPTSRTHATVHYGYGYLTPQESLLRQILDWFQNWEKHLSLNKCLCKGSTRSAAVLYWKRIPTPLLLSHILHDPIGLLSKAVVHFRVRDQLLECVHRLHLVEHVLEVESPETWGSFPSEYSRMQQAISIRIAREAINYLGIGLWHTLVCNKRSNVAAITEQLSIIIR